jgi:tRNA(Ile)-lysidine synthase
MQAKGFVRKLRLALQRHQLLPERGVVVVACSGGADSLALLLGLHQLSQSALSSILLHVAHLDHGLREASAADGAFVAEVAAKLALPCTVGRVTATERAAWRGSLEAVARTARYHFLREVARDVGAERIALGHTLEDQAETVLMHFIRGSGVDGLVGMRPRMDDLIRPLLTMRHAETRAFCQEQGFTPREDATNDDPRYTRNRMRRELLPLLATYQPQILTTLARNAEAIAPDLDLLQSLTAQAWDTAIMHVTADRIVLNRTALRGVHPALRLRVLRRAITQMGGPKPDAHLNADSLARLVRVIMDASGERRVVQLSTGAVAICQQEQVIITLPSDERISRPPGE